MTRLDALKSIIVSADVIADVGCDHGLVAGYCAKSGLARHVIASDISEKCLKKAVDGLAGTDNISFVVCDGIGYACDEAVIAGMGGLLICDILDRAKSEGRLPQTLALMPHRDAEAVRRKLTDCGYGIEQDFMIKDRGRYYSAIRAVMGGGKTELDDTEYAYGAYCRQRSEVLTEYLQKERRVYAVAPEKNANKLNRISVALDIQSAAGADKQE